MGSDIFIIVCSLVLSAFFSGMEIAYVSANKIHIEIEKKQNDVLSRILERLTRKPSKFIATMLVGNNVALVVYGFFMGDLLLEWLTGFKPVDNAIISYFLGSGLILTQTVISTLVILFTAEFLPKVFFQIYANSLLKAFAIPAYIFYVLFHILSSFVIWISDVLLKLFFKTSEDDVQLAFSKVELGHYIEEQLDAVEETDQVDSEVQIFQNALQFSDIKAREVMIPRTEIIAVAVETTPEDIIDLFTQTGLSKILVYRESNDDIIGYIHSFDLFKNPRHIESVMLPVLHVPETVPAKDILNTLTKRRISIAVVLDEYGGTSGMMTIEDIVEELFGEIEDEHDSPLLIEEQLDEQRFQFSARMEIDYINETYKLELPQSEYYETLGGLIVNFTEEIPEKDGEIEIEGFTIKILDVSETRIELVEVTKKE